MYNIKRVGWVMVFNATFNNISVISWQSVSWVFNVNIQLLTRSRWKKCFSSHYNSIYIRTMLAFFYKSLPKKKLVKLTGRTRSRNDTNFSLITTAHIRNILFFNKYSPPQKKIVLVKITGLIRSRTDTILMSKYLEVK